MTKCQRLATLIAVSLAGLCSLTATAIAGNYSVVDQPPVRPSWVWAPPPTATSSSLAAFNGTLRLYVVEPDSRWSDYYGNRYHFGFIDFALDSAVSITDGQRIILSRTWTASSSGYGGFTEDNIMIVAALIDDEVHVGYSLPPNGNEFYAYYVEAAAAAGPGTSDSNNTSANSTHTVLLEEATANYCTYCPSVNYWVNNVYSTGLYNFHLITHVRDMNFKSYQYLQNYSIYGVPTCYFDGGDGVVLGGQSSATPFTSALLDVGQRSVQGAGLMVRVEWLNPSGDLGIDVILANGVAVDDPPVAAVPEGELHPRLGQTYEYTTSATDAESDELFFKFAWGDGEESDWLGPFASGSSCTQAHSWTAQGDYSVTVKCRDAWYVESAWTGPLTVGAGCCTLRGDLNTDGSLKVSDLTFLVNYLFRSGSAPQCDQHGDINSDGNIKVSDLTFLVNYLFRTGAAPGACY